MINRKYIKGRNKKNNRKRGVGGMSRRKGKVIQEMVRQERIGEETKK